MHLCVVYKLSIYLTRFIIINYKLCFGVRQCRSIQAEPDHMIDIIDQTQTHCSCNGGSSCAWHAGPGLQMSRTGSQLLLLTRTGAGAGADLIN